jgi:3-deoxy-D-manno-octulosonic-acid transferase
MIRGLYSVLMLAAQPFLRRKLARRGRAEAGYLEAVEERFGRYAVAAPEGAVWLHAVSLGETRAAAILVEKLREQMPGMRLLLTHGTATGRAEGAKLLRPGDAQAWLPWDTPGAVKRFLDYFNPRVGILMETEVWPNLSAACQARGVPLALANARLSAKSEEQALKLGPLSQPAYASLAAVWAQTSSDAQRLRDVGASVSAVFGNLKFDAAHDETRLAQGKAWRAATGRPVVMFASSREGEEAQLLDVLHTAGGSDAQWLIVPRHPQRFDEVAALIERHGFSVSRRSAWEDAPAPADVWLGDSLGDMALYYGLADVALLGGSFEPMGGQNLIEAAACGCPVVMGLSTYNFAEAAELALEAGAARRVASIQQGVQEAVAIVGDEAQQLRLARAAQAFSQAHRGAADRTAQAVLALLASASANGDGK